MVRYRAVNHHERNILSCSLDICMFSDFYFGVYFSCSLVHQYFQSCCFYCYHVAAVMNIFLDIHPVGRAVTKLETKKKTELLLLSISTCINDAIFSRIQGVNINRSPNFHSIEVREKTVSRVRRRLRQNTSSHDAILNLFHLPRVLSLCFSVWFLLVGHHSFRKWQPHFFLLSPFTGWREDPSVWLDAMERSIDVISGVVPVLSVFMKDGNVSLFVAFCVCCVSSMRGSLFASRKVLRCSGFDWRGARSLLWICKSWAL